MKKIKKIIEIEQVILEQTVTEQIAAIKESFNDFLMTETQIIALRNLVQAFIDTQYTSQDALENDVNFITDIFLSAHHIRQ